jgi:hypothetical protein
MIPYILAAVGGWLIGDSVKDKAVFADGGGIDNWIGSYKKPIKTSDVSEFLNSTKNDGHKYSLWDKSVGVTYAYNGKLYANNGQVLPKGTVIDLDKVMNFWGKNNCDTLFVEDEKLVILPQKQDKYNCYTTGYDGMKNSYGNEDDVTLQEAVEFCWYYDDVRKKYATKEDLEKEIKSTPYGKNNIIASTGNITGVVVYKLSTQQYADGGKINDLIGKKVTINKSDYSQVNGKVVKVSEQKISLDFGKGIKGEEKNVWVTIEDERGKEHTGTLDSVFAKGGITYTDKRDGAVYTTGKNDRGEWTVYSESPNWAKRDEFENGLESEEDAIMLAKQMSGIEVEREPFAQGGEVANTILQQLGGAGKLRMMTGAYNFIDTGNGVSFRLKNPRANFVKIKLNGKDLYDIEVGRVRGNTYKIVKEQNDLFFDQLKPFIEEATGLYLSLFSNGGLVENPVFTFKTKSDYDNARNSGYIPDFDIVRVVVGNSDFPVYSEEEYEELLAAGNITSSYQDKSYYDIQDYEVDEDDDTEADDGGYMADGGLVQSKYAHNISDKSVEDINIVMTACEEDDAALEFNDSETIMYFDENGLSPKNRKEVQQIFSHKMAKGGMVVTSIKDIPNFKQRLDEGKITYRGLGLGKLWDDFNKLTGTTGTRIKVDGKEYFITDEEFNTFSRGADGKVRIRFAAPFKKSYADGGYMADGGKVGYYAKGSKVKKRARFVDKVEAIADSLEGKKVPRRLQNDYGKRYNRDEAEQAGRRIAGSMKKKYEI